MALADVDGLRAVNNGLGHPAGDQLLHAIADRLTHAVPPGGLLARLGGDEFILLAPDTDPATLATAIGTGQHRRTPVAAPRQRRYRHHRRARRCPLRPRPRRRGHVHGEGRRRQPDPGVRPGPRW
ncbi:MAG: GGDEF domain-containing protein [Actinobacteria bacterium]|nr:MAG: GGDEF domain-containing protein [Actinomycetota bacterium]